MKLINVIHIVSDWYKLDNNNNNILNVKASFPDGALRISDDDCNYRILVFCC